MGAKSQFQWPPEVHMGRAHAAERAPSVPLYVCCVEVVVEVVSEHQTEFSGALAGDFSDMPSILYKEGVRTCGLGHQMGPRRVARAPVLQVEIIKKCNTAANGTFWCYVCCSVAHGRLFCTNEGVRTSGLGH